MAKIEVGHTYRVEFLKDMGIKWHVQDDDVSHDHTDEATKGEFEEIGLYKYNRVDNVVQFFKTDKEFDSELFFLSDFMSLDDLDFLQRRAVVWEDL